MKYTTIVTNDKRTAFVLIEGYKYALNIDHIALKDAIIRARFVANTLNERHEYVTPDQFESIPTGTQHLVEVLARIQNERELARNQ